MFSSYAHDYDHVFKILIVGNPNVGKTCLVSKYIDDLFIEEHIPTISFDGKYRLDFKVRNLSIDVGEEKEKLFKLQIWDSASEESFKRITSSYYRGVYGVIVMYDMTNEQSFYDLNIWTDQINHYAPGNVVKILVGNKSDKKEEKMIGTEVAKAFADHHGMLFKETSVKENNPEEIFETLVKEIYDKKFSGYTGLGCECCRIPKKKPKEEETDPIIYFFGFFFLLGIIGGLIKFFFPDS